MPKKLLTVFDVSESDLCCGCGACAYLRPHDIDMIDVPDQGRRPVLKPGRRRNGTSDEALKACPGIELEHTFKSNSPGLINELTAGWGPIYELWEGHAADEQIRFAGSSGGAATALALFALEKKRFHGVLHTAARENAPFLNETVMSYTREELVKRAGSRYAPASPCDGLQRIEDAPGPCVFIGKPCDVAGAQKARRIRPDLDAKLQLTIAFFCAGTPSTRGTLEMLAVMGVANPEQVVQLRYRGNGWPGKATAVYRKENGTEETTQLSYRQSWGDILQKHRQWRCYLCIDHTGEFADIAVGDPWYQGVPDDAPGRSLILARTERGRAFLAEAVSAGYLHATPAEAWKLPASQTAFRKIRGKVWARLWSLRLLGFAAPKYLHMPTARFWLLDLSLIDKLKSFLHIAKRAYAGKLRRSLRSSETRPFSVSMPTDLDGVNRIRNSK